jgi:NACHT domain
MDKIMYSAPRWWLALSQESRDKLFTAIATAVVTLLATIVIPKLVWPIVIRALTATKEYIFSKFAGYSIFHPWARRRYLRNLRTSLERLTNPWSTEKQFFRATFVPIKVDTRYQLPHFVPGSKQPDQLSDLSAAARRYLTFVLVGDPGGGKTTALKSIGLATLDNTLYLESDIIPVFVEIRRYANTTCRLEQYLVQVLRDYGFPNADRFIARQLEKNQILLLLDGLDEVSDLALSRILTSIREFSNTHPHNRLVISCRIASYDRQLDDISEATIALTAFNDIQISAFVRHKSFPAGKSAVQLMSILRERPRILAVCRNPLLLTIVTSLYAETDYDLPSSRPEFYESCIEALLRRWDYSREVDRKNRFNISTKMRVLQHLAVTLQMRDNPAADATHEELIVIIADLLPSLGLTAGQAEDLLQEIIKNTGLLMYVGPSRLRFSHLTFQEFFAARELDSLIKLDVLLDRISAAGAHWREVAVLFCGISRKATYLIERIARRDPRLAAACISENGAVPSEVAVSVLEMLEREIQPLIGQRSDEAGAADCETNLRAIASLAADTRASFATRAFRFLRKCLNQSNEKLVWAAIRAFAYVPTTEAAAELVGILTRPETRYVAKSALKQLGPVGLPAMQAMLARGDLDADIQLLCLELCASVVTPEVIDIILPFVRWEEPSLRSAVAAYSLGVLLRDPSIEQALRLIKATDLSWSPLSPEVVAKAWPFEEGDNGILPQVASGLFAALIPELLGTVALRYEGDQFLDTRIGVPVCICAYESLHGQDAQDSSQMGKRASKFEAIATKVLFGGGQLPTFDAAVAETLLNGPGVSTYAVVPNLGSFKISGFFTGAALDLWNEWMEVDHDNRRIGRSGARLKTCRWRTLFDLVQGRAQPHSHSVLPGESSEGPTRAPGSRLSF